MKRIEPTHTPWTRLTEAARRAPQPSAEVPFGFSARVAALAMSEPPRSSWTAMLDQFSWRALGVSALLVALSLAASYSAMTSPSEDDWTLSDPLVAMAEAS